MNHYKEMHQGLNVSGVGDHHQNSQDKDCIRSVQDLARCYIIRVYH